MKLNSGIIYTAKNMFNNTFLKFLITFVIIILASFLIMGFVSGMKIGGGSL